MRLVAPGPAEALPHGLDALVARVRGLGNRAAEQLLIQLDLLEREATAIAGEFAAADARRRADHTRYQRDRARRDDQHPGWRTVRAGWQDTRHHCSYFGKELG